MTQWINLFLKEGKVVTWVKHPKLVIEKKSWWLKLETHSIQNWNMDWKNKNEPHSIDNEDMKLSFSIYFKTKNAK